MGACNCSTETLDVNNRCRWRPTTRATKRGGRRAGIGASGRTNTGAGNRKGNEERQGRRRRNKRGRQKPNWQAKSRRRKGEEANPVNRRSTGRDRRMSQRRRRRRARSGRGRHRRGKRTSRRVSGTGSRNNAKAGERERPWAHSASDGAQPWKRGSSRPN